MIDIQVDSREVGRAFEALGREGREGARAAVNSLAFGVANYWPKIVEQSAIDDPKPFTKRRLFIRKAGRAESTPIAVVEMGRIQADYLRHVIDGTSRGRKRIEERAGIPTARPSRTTKVDRFGNVPRRRYLSVLEQAKNNEGRYFIIDFKDATPARPAGIWRWKSGRRRSSQYTDSKGRPRDRPIELVFMFIKRNDYPKRLQFNQPIERWIDRNYAEATREAIEFATRKAAATSRR